ncbi:MAG: protein phosphatase 2C domain-containing protein [Lachnospiraceae bacterium]|nr:protein phosphatase 2C domain-containing protein [Lachnospiraceae bacterium]
MDWIKIGIIAGAVAALALLLGVILFFIISRKKKKKKESEEMSLKPDIPPQTAPLEASTTAVLGEFSIPIVDEAPVGLGECRTEMLYPISDYAEIGLASLKGTREYQQDTADAFISSADGDRAVGILCDGMGGMEGGEKASALAVSEMRREMTAPWKEFPGNLLDILTDVNQMVHNLRDERTGRRLQAGTTLTTVIMEGNQLYWCSVGDSRIYLFRDGRLTQLTKDHTYGDELDELAATGQITRETAASTPGRAALTSYLGIPHLEKIGWNRSPEELAGGDIVLQCSDGLYRSLGKREMEYIISESLDDMQLAARRLTATAVSKPGPHDNTTALLICYKGTAGSSI